MLEIINGLISSTIATIPIYVFGLLILKDRTNKRNKKIYDIILILVSIIIHAFIFISLQGTIKTIVFCGLLMLTYKFLFNISYLKSLLSSIIYIIVLLIPDLLTIGIATKLIGISKDYYYSIIVGSIYGNILVAAGMILVVYILKKPLKKLINYNISTSKKIVFMSILTILFIIYFFYQFANGYQLNENIIIYLIAIFGFIIVLFTLFKQKIENEAISKKYDDLLSIMKNYESDIEEQRTMIHETRNELMTIKSKISDKEKEASIIKYIDSILGDKVSSNMSKYSKFMYLPSNGIKGFFYYKFMEAEKRGISVSVNISKKIEKSFLGNLETKNFKDLVRIIGVYLDNAIEASERSKERKLGIEIYLMKEDIEIIISNTFENKIDIKKLGIERFTTKDKNRGHGLLLVKYILKSNEIIEGIQEINRNIFIQKIKIKSNKKTQQ